MWRDGGRQQVREQVREGGRGGGERQTGRGKRGMDNVSVCLRGNLKMIVQIGASDMALPCLSLFISSFMYCCYCSSFLLFMIFL